MIFFADKNGDVVKVMPGSVHQGSANADEICLFAPFPKNIRVTAAFRLPDGSVTEPALMQSVGAVWAAGEEAGDPLAGWTYVLPACVAEKYGSVAVQFYFYAGEQGTLSASGEAVFSVSRGVRAELPETPDADIYQEILQDIAALSGDVGAGYYAARSVYAWNAAYIYGANELVFVPDAGEYGAILRSKANENTHAPYEDGVLQSEYWEEAVSFDAVHAANAEAAASALSAQTSAGNAESYAAAAETAKSEAETAKTAAQAAQAGAESAKTAAESAKDDAFGHAENAADSASDAAGCATRAQAYMEQAKRYAQKEYQLYDGFEELPNPGDSAYIYLVPASGGSGNDSYSEYLWITETGKYEFIGNVNDVDLSGYAQVNGTYPNMTVGNASNATNAGHAETADGATNADSATKATQDGSGNNIVDTYATKTELNNSLATKANTSGSYNDLYVGHANSADSATKATQDGNGNPIADTYATKTELNNSLAVKANTSGYYADLSVGSATNAQNASNAAYAAQAAQATAANAATQAQLGQSGVPSASDDDKIVTTEYLYPGSAEGNGVSSFSFVYRGVTHSVNIQASYVNATSNWMRVVRSGNTVTIGWTLAIKTTLSKGTNYTIASGLPNAAHTENNYCVGIAPDGTVFTVYVNTSGQIILRPQTGNLTSQTVYLGCTYLTNEA
ncbi:MAG TPA: hypothetical protein H9708_00740 [Candidatus Borkfalkia stercoripullorum]|nr:hypothetical protein [Candidatus Borkfalkia stercoripullorum]